MLTRRIIPCFDVKGGRMGIHTQELPLSVFRITVIAGSADAEITVHAEGH